MRIKMVPEAGIEPAWSCLRWILSPVRLPISPLRQKLTVNVTAQAKIVNNFCPDCDQLLSSVADNTEI
jgi:hypothetical protein